MSAQWVNSCKISNLSITNSFCCENGHVRTWRTCLAHGVLNTFARGSKETVFQSPKSFSRSSAKHGCTATRRKSKTATPLHRNIVSSFLFCSVAIQPMIVRLLFLSTKWEDGGCSSTSEISSGCLILPRLPTSFFLQ